MTMTRSKRLLRVVNKIRCISSSEDKENTKFQKMTIINAHNASQKLEKELAARIEEVSLRKSSGFFPNDLEVFQKPMCLISTEGESALKLETEVAEQIAKIDWPIVVVSVVGLYRTGKSYLMNRLAQSTKGFALGDTIESTTKGIWVWCKIHPDKTNTVLLLLDTEGLGDVDKGDPSHDNKIFTLATLLCNCLVYNMKGAFDQDAVSKLTFVTEMAKNIRFRGKSSDDNSSLNLILPDFVLCVRDFSLRLSKGGKTITEDEYLEQSLAIRKGKDDKFNKPRECILTFFPKRRCFTFPVPGDDEVLENLETLEFSQLSKRFKDATTRFVSCIYSCQPKDLLASKPINGQMFSTLATHFVTAIQNGAVPDVDDAFSAAAKIENSRIGREASEIYKGQMQTIVLPVPSKDLESCYTKAQQLALDYLRKNVVLDKDGECEIKAQMEMDNLWNQLKEENTQKVHEKCYAYIEQAYKESMEKKIENKAYEVSGGHRMYQQDIEKMKKEFMSSHRDFEDNEILWTWLGFMKTIEENETKIIEADDALTAKDKEDERKRNEESMKALVEEHKKSEQDALVKQRIAMEEHFKKLEDDRKEQERKEMLKFKELLEAKLEKEQAEKELKEMKAHQQQKDREFQEMKKQQEQKDREFQVMKAREKQKDRELNEMREKQAQTARDLINMQATLSSRKQDLIAIEEMKSRQEQQSRQYEAMKAESERKKSRGFFGRLKGAIFND